MPTTATLSNDATPIRERLNAWIKAVHVKDLDALMALYAPDAVAFDLMPPQQVQSADRYRKNFERWFTGMQGPIQYEIQDLRVVTSADVAFCHSLSHIRGTRATGEKADYWVRVTVGFQRRNGQWWVIHDHVSMPIDMETMNAVSDLRQSRP